MNSAPPEIVFSYRLRGWSVLFSIALLLLFAALMLFMAVTESDRFIGIHLGMPYGAVGYGIIGLAVASLAGLMFAKLLRDRRKPREIRFGAQSVTLPRSLLSARMITLDYAEIETVEREKAQRAAMNFIRLRGTGGITRISDLGFARQGDFDAVLALLRQRVAESRAD